MGSAYLNGEGYIPKSNGNDHMSICPYGVYSCKASFFMLGCATEIQFKKLMQMLNLEIE